MANDHTGFPGTWETLPSPSCLPAGAPAYQLQVDPQLCPELVGTNRGQTDGIAKGGGDTAEVTLYISLFLKAT